MARTLTTVPLGEEELLTALNSLSINLSALDRSHKHQGPVQGLDPEEKKPTPVDYPGP